LNARALLISTAALLALASPAFAQVKATEVVKTYAVTGTTGPELYESIGENGPRIGGMAVTGTIAHTNFDLKWRRNYQREGDGCRLASAIPFLTVTYTVPKPRGTLPLNTKRLWDTFSAGILAHEKVHGQQILAMANTIYSETVGFFQPDDPDCQKIREAIQPLLAAASNKQRAEARDFDRAEMSEGGNVHQLILNLVNGGR
jgi:predicted secreted Zn-dependent protease